ncbi:O-antigen ligase [Pedobacter sp. SYP-B3415]|uniref:O-antigen ligase family protein n=1 Tax=Pedobacter sp. SYP-B3415 TaxID=2496641 RepID=UPI00101CEDFD|nr:O-antigen ligase family protein [Pedobacter sp. SYP-B3415]
MKSVVSDKKTALYLVLTIGGLLFSALIGMLGIVGAGAIGALVAGIPLVYLVVTRPKFGIMVLILMAFLVMWVIRMGVINFPLGTLMDGMEALLILGFFIKQKQRPDWSFMNKPISILVLIWVTYNLVQVANPVAESRMAWLYTIRSVAAVMLLFFVFCYQFDRVWFIRWILKMWLTLSFFAALYAIKQEVFGFSQFELNSISDPLTTNLLFIDGHWRKFSIFSDPVAFSYNMVIGTIICIVLIFGRLQIWKKVILAALAILFMVVMLFSGTRGAYVLLPAAMVLLAVMNYNRRVLIFAVIGGIFFLLLVRLPTSNPAIARFQSAFTPSDDASFNLRKMNQKRIQPYILSHPIGGGLGATGVWGVRFAPYSFLANFPPDSGYVRVAVELGWIGLGIFCTLMFVILRTGINNYYLIRDPELKTYTLAMVLVIFALGIGNYPQEALVQFPNNILFYLSAAMIVACKKLDDEQNATSILQ